MNSEEDEFKRIEAEAKRQAAQQALPDERNFCPRCGKRTKDIHTCTPPQRQWVGLTDEEMSDIVADIDVDFGDLLWKVVCLTKIIQATIKERNT